MKIVIESIFFLTERVVVLNEQRGNSCGNCFLHQTVNSRRSLVSHARDQWFESTSGHHINQEFQAVDISGFLQWRPNRDLNSLLRKTRSLFLCLTLAFSAKTPRAIWFNGTIWGLPLFFLVWISLILIVLKVRTTLKWSLKFLILPANTQTLPYNGVYKMGAYTCGAQSIN